MDLSGAQQLGHVVQWCGVCNAEPAVGQLEVEHEEHEMPMIPVGYDCLRNIAAEQGGIKGWTDEYDTLDKDEIVW